MVKFLAELGVPEFQHHLENAPSYANYLSDATVTELINIISNQLEDGILKSAKFWLISLLSLSMKAQMNKIVCRWLYSSIGIFARTVITILLEYSMLREQTQSH